MQNEICCPKFNPELWDEKETTWENKVFVQDRVKSFFHVPINFGSVMKKNVALIEAANAKSEEMIVLSDEDSLWGSNVFIEVTKDVPNVKTATMSGTYLSKVFEGSYKDMGMWIKEMKEYTKTKNKELKKMYFYYTTCPTCVKKYGKNYVVILAQV